MIGLANTEFHTELLETAAQAAEEILGATLKEDDESEEEKEG